MAGALQVLDTLQPHKTLALASSSYRDAVDGVLERLGITPYFAVIVTGTEVPRSKPAPDIFLAAAQQIGVAPAACVVVEDAEKGVIAASRAGMRCIAVPNRDTRHHDFSHATWVCASLHEITVELIERLGS
jgi:HAD superfamily hydrolase (TIGR01509 family)